MAIRELSIKTDVAFVRELTDAVKAELRRRETQPAPGDAPVVFRDSSGIGKYRHYFVVWDRFSSLSQEIRSSIVLNAVKEVLGKKEALKVTIAMGLTKEEAKNMGFEV
jgi:hypothetical protein